jgi:hypothetical protein
MMTRQHLAQHEVTATLLPIAQVLGFGHLASRMVHAVRVTSHPHQQWMGQVARNMTMAFWVFEAVGLLDPR